MLLHFTMALTPALAGLIILMTSDPAFAYGFTLGFMLSACSAG
jgi:hypothetical protein